ncbi:hypothetical protein CPB83DRAFT_919695 [Crepidotus variabilis]|uniref:F-box domain-containing protein n=1 Tax=Crepidotus variabilis TaxID=179855 RepID=A0A9P6E3X4_9AGAR|nr:hypothetical protein CPB83DRAFT_919695 [Crepidotus variabilis]
MTERGRAERRSAVETELTLAKAKISQLQRGLFDIRQRLNDTTPILDILPADIMVQIFQHLLPRHLDSEIAGYGCLVKPVQLMLGAVCRTWRSIAWKFPGLWKEISLTVADPGCTEVRVGLVQEWILRTGGLPLRISLSVQATEDDAVLDRVLRILLQECWRWRTFEIAGNATHQLRTEMSEGDYFFPMLTSISLGANSHTVPSPMKIPWTFNTDFSLTAAGIGF